MDTVDERCWWFCGANTWPGVHPFEAFTARSALAKYRRTIIDAERAGGRSARDAVALVQAAQLFVVAGPLSTTEAREREFGWCLAWAICDKSTHQEIPLSPATLADAKPWLSEREIQRIREYVDRTLPLTRDRHPAGRSTE